MNIFRQVIRFFQSLRQVSSILKNIRLQKEFIRKNIEPDLAAAKKINDGSLEEDDLKKIRQYYGLAVPAILGEAFCALRGKKMTQKERLTSTCQGAMTGLADDFFDKQKLSEEALVEYIERPQGIEGNTVNEKLSLQLYRNALANVPDAAAMRLRLYRVFQAQVLSKKQSRNILSIEELKDITLRKGAESLLLYRTAFGNPLKPGEEKMLYCLGGLMQLSNDIFDIHPDLEQNIQTLVTTAKDIRALRLYYSALLKIGHQAALETNYPKKNTRQFLDIISIGIFSRCFVCLDQLQKNQSRSNNVFAPHKYKRKDLVCDMDTVANKWRSLKYHVKMEH